MTNLRELLEDLIARVRGTDIAELEVRKRGVRVAIRRRRPGGLVAANPGETSAPPVATAEPGPGEADIVSPLNGIFYSSAAPGEAPFVEVGHQIVPGQVVGLVEPMKVFNEILAEVAGTVIAEPAVGGAEILAGGAVLRVRLASSE